MTKQISIIGCGWLGLPLANALIKNGFQVNGSTTSVEKLELLKSFDIDPYLIHITENSIKGDIFKCLDVSNIVIINIPPGLRKGVGLPRAEARPRQGT